jgi:hypothetical protein
MRQIKQNEYWSPEKPFINDICIVIPFDDFDEQRDIVSNLRLKRTMGYKIKGIEVIDGSKCVMYREPNSSFRR